MRAERRSSTREPILPPSLTSDPSPVSSPAFTRRCQKHENRGSAAFGGCVCAYCVIRGSNACTYQPCERVYGLISSLFWPAALRFLTFSTLTSKKQVPPLVFYPTLSLRHVLGRRSLTLASSLEPPRRLRNDSLALSFPLPVSSLLSSHW